VVQKRPEYNPVGKSKSGTLANGIVLKIITISIFKFITLNSGTISPDSLALFRRNTHPSSGLNNNTPWAPIIAPCRTISRPGYLPLPSKPGALKMGNNDPFDTKIFGEFLGKKGIGKG
jgi:hypothetical protein